MSDEELLRVSLGQRIRAIRSTRGWTGQKLADLADISPAYLSEVERGRSEISGAKLLRIATSLEVSVQELLEGTTPKIVTTSSVLVPEALSQAAEDLNLSFLDTTRLLESKRSLMARRSKGAIQEWDASKWKAFYESVKEFLDEKEGQ